MLTRFLPFLKWFEGYNTKTFRYDLIAGLTVALVLIPQLWFKDGAFRNTDRFGLAEYCHISIIRFQGSLTFANCNYMEEKVLEQISINPDSKYVLIGGNAIYEIDASGEGMISTLVQQLREADYEIYF